MSALYLGDFKETQTLHFKWSSNAAAGESITRATNGTIKVYKDDSTTEITTGITDTEDHDSNTGIHHVKIDLNASASYAKHADYSVIIDAATIDGKVINAPIAHFSIENRQDSALVRYSTPSGFDERSGPASAKITRSGFPAYAVVYTADGATPTKDDFDGNILVGARIGSVSGQSGEFIIIGGYFFDDSDDTTDSVFGIALDTARFGITEGGSTVLSTNWTGAGTEPASGSGWTFIVIDTPEAFPVSSDALEIWINPSILRGAFVSENSVPDVNVKSWADFNVSNSTNNFPKVDMASISNSGSAADNLEDIAVASKGSDDKILISTDAQDLSLSLDVNAKRISGSITAADDVEANISNLDATVSSRATPAQVNTEAQNVIVANNLDHLLKIAAVDADAVDNSIIAQLAAKGATADFSTFDNTTDSLEALSDGMTGAGLTSQQVRDAMKLAPTAGSPATGSVDEHLDTLLTNVAAAQTDITTILGSTTDALKKADFVDYRNITVLTTQELANGIKIPATHEIGTGGNKKTVTTTVNTNNDFVAAEVAA